MRTLTLAVFLVAGAVNLQLPLYATYAEDAGLGAGSMSLLLAGYVGALLPCLMLLGGTSDRLGRRPVVLTGLMASLLATVIVMVEPSAVGLGIARWFQGVGVALCFGAAAAWMAELDGAARSAGATSLASTAGFGFGALVTSGWRMLEPGGVPWTYGGWALALVVATVAVGRLESPVSADALAPLMRRPSYPPGSVLPALAIGVGWGVAGIVVAVLPGVLDGFGDGWSGVALFVLLGSGVFAQRHARTVPGHRALLIGAGLLPVGVAILATGVAVESIGWVLLGAAVAGTSTHGYGYLGGLATVTRLGDSPARSVSGYFLAAYLGFGAPAVVMGIGVDTFGAAAAFAGLAVLVGTLGTLLGAAVWRAHTAESHRT